MTDFRKAMHRSAALWIGLLLVEYAGTAMATHQVNPLEWATWIKEGAGMLAAVLGIAALGVSPIWWAVDDEDWE